MKAVKGFMTADGTFYDSDVDARLHEAVQTIKVLCDSHKPKGIAPEKFLSLLSNWSTDVREFLDANDKAKATRVSADQEDTGPIGGDQADDAHGDALDEAVVEQPLSGSEHVPKVGLRTSPESVQPRIKKHGFRSRGDDA